MNCTISKDEGKISSISLVLSNSIKSYNQLGKFAPGKLGLYEIWKRLLIGGGVHILGTVLVICCNPNIRKFYVDNLTVRGYPTIGLISMSREDSEPSKNCVLGQVTPDLVLMWGALAALEPDIENIRQSYADSVPIIVVSDERPAPAWMTKWKIADHRSGLSDGRKLMNFLQRWLN